MVRAVRFVCVSLLLLGDCSTFSMYFLYSAIYLMKRFNFYYCFFWLCFFVLQYFTYRFLLLSSFRFCNLVHLLISLAVYRLKEIYLIKF